MISYNNLNQSNLFYSNPKNIQFLKNLINDSYSAVDLDNTFTLFKSIYDIFFPIYSTKNISIIIYNLLDDKIINKIKNSHVDIIINLRHFLDTTKKRDLIISISKDDNLKIWIVNNIECIYNYNNIGKITLSCLLIENNQLNLLISADYYTQ